jgi:polyphosphate glucokinase
MLLLVPNLEIGHLEIRNEDSEKRCSDAVRKRKDLTWKQWSKRFNEYISYLEKYFWPDLFILGGGICKNYDKFKNYIKSKTPVVRAQLGNEAGIVGAALAVHDRGV